MIKHNILKYITFIYLLSLPISVLGQESGKELVYGEMEFPLSFVTQARGYTFNPLSRFLTDVEGRLLELTADPLVDVYQKTEGQTECRPGLATWRPVSLRNTQILSFTLFPFTWVDGRKISFDDVRFSLEYRKLNEEGWEASRELVIEKRGEQVFDLYLGNDPMKLPEPGQLYFPLINKAVFTQTTPISQAKIDKKLQSEIGAGRYKITNIVENTSITMERRSDHPYYDGLDFKDTKPINTIRMHAFPKARINRNEQFIEGRIHLITSVTQADLDYIMNAYPKATVVKYSDDSFSGFTFNCANPYLASPAIRRAFNYIFRKELALKKALGGEGELISGPIPRRNFFYNLTIPPYEDSKEKGLFMLKAYFYLGLELIEKDGSVIVSKNVFPAENRDLKDDDIIIEVVKEKVDNLLAFENALKFNEKSIRIRVIRENRRMWVNFSTEPVQHKGLMTNIQVEGGTVKEFPALTLIANNPEGKSPLIKEICGALQEDMEKIGIQLKLDYLPAHEYYPRLRNGEFDLAYRTIKITGTPNLYQLFFYNPSKDAITTSNYGRYFNTEINELAKKTRDSIDISTVEAVWKTAHRVLHWDPPQLFLWSSRHILVYDPKIEVVTPDDNYKIPHGYKQINGLINIFNDVHLWRWKEE